MKRTDAGKGPLLEAAEKLESLLAEYERTAADLARTPLDSRRNVERASQTLTRIAGLDEQLAGHASALVGVIASLRDRQQAQANTVQQRATEVLARREALGELLDRLTAIAEGVRSVGTLLEQARGGDESVALDEVLDKISALTTEAHGFASEAQTRGFADLAADGHALRQQLQSINNKATLIRGGVAGKPSARPS